VEPTVLIVDDHSGFRSWARAFLQTEGWLVVGEANDGEEAIAAARTLSPLVVLLDVQLPGRDGFEVAEVLARVVPKAAVVLTSSRSADDYTSQLDQALGRVVRGFIGKEDLTGAALDRIIGGER
jgi:DNA-binding NarL/FixJ family response regulator